MTDVITLTKDDDLHLKLEFSPVGLVYHLDIYKPWTKALRERVKSVVRHWTNYLGPTYAAYHRGESDPKLKKFIQIVGGNYHHTVITPKGPLELYLFRPLD